MLWDSFHNCSAAIGGHQIFRRDGLGWKGGRVWLYVKAAEMPGALPRGEWWASWDFVSQEYCAGRHKQCCSDCLLPSPLCSVVWWTPLHPWPKRDAQESRTWDFAFYADHMKMLKVRSVQKSVKDKDFYLIVCAVSDTSQSSLCSN